MCLSRLLEKVLETRLTETMVRIPGEWQPNSPAKTNLKWLATGRLFFHPQEWELIPACVLAKEDSVKITLLIASWFSVN